MKILVTGGCGYIGSHTAVSLLEAGYEVVCVDDNSRSSPAAIDRIEKATGKRIPLYAVDLKDLKALEAVFAEHADIWGVIHFAAYKAVGESVKKPLMYYENNLVGLLNVLRCVEAHGIKNFVFSSSCTVYGQPDESPVSESTPQKPAACPYGATKQMGEQILQDFVKRSDNKQAVALLRYFNPAGAHPSLELGEDVRAGVQSLTSAIVSSAADGKVLKIFGNDYATSDGTCVRDFIHVSDIADAHVLALKYIDSAAEPCTVLNLGSGKPHTVFEAVQTFQKCCGELKYEFVGRRPGDIAAIYSDNTLARNRLGWEVKYTMEDIMRTAWGYQKKCL